ncbi:hypothetical protein [Brenneria rubrifaciens]|uniref:Type III effector n=1 Tax=Brenneria rubrifaciens TaxID=55213 RepID=A0A4P8QPT9_9GAMM|nr:hypothetical protein [Brenneria rubrifaciens]QCR09117.1 hypothetical protein EH207_11625 [Brenneria rubrifaciens]
MNRFSSLFSSGSSSSSSHTWNALEADNHSSTKIHQSYSAQSLGLSQYQYRTVQVKSSTMDALADAAWANKVVKNVLHAGAGNQIQDISESYGESWARNHLASDAYSGGATINQLKRAQKFQGGNCPVSASVAAVALQGRTDAPIYRLRTSLPQGGNHEFILLGDRRSSQWGDSNTVVVDPWPHKPSASTFDQAFLQDARTGQQTPLQDVVAHYRSEEYKAREVSSSDRNRLSKIKPMDTDTINHKLAKQHLPTIGNDLVSHIYATQSHKLFDARVSTDPSTHYTDGYDTKSFDTL